MAEDTKLPSRRSSPSEVADFVARLTTQRDRFPAPGPEAGQGGSLIFALDATASRQPTWDRAARIQAEMFQETRALGGLALQVCFYRGFGEFRASPWLTDGDAVLRLMSSVFCAAGETQIRKVLRHALNESDAAKVGALVFVGDCVEEDVDRLGADAGRLGLKGVPAFMFQEGDEPLAAFAFKEIARLTGGAYCRFDAASPTALRDLLSAVAVYAAGGQGALKRLSATRGGEVRLIAHQLRDR
jgi:hypothetical protein